MQDSSNKRCRTTGMSKTWPLERFQADCKKSERSISCLSEQLYHPDCSSQGDAASTVVLPPRVVRLMLKEIIGFRFGPSKSLRLRLASVRTCR